MYKLYGLEKIFYSRRWGSSLPGLSTLRQHLLGEKQRAQKERKKEIEREEYLLCAGALTPLRPISLLGFVEAIQVQLDLRNTTL